MARWMMIAGAVLLVSGALWQFAPWLLHWFGRLPGDIRIESERVTIYFPLTSMLILSLLLTLLLHFFKR